ncbi:protein spinster homolog 1-like isoform X3 [Ostrea edulis]|uniref:protein spinster homolog 1-like isoform X3 n=1 Tax=Ostrea edulis TaxID=37623 RepID=UPI0020964C4B|nr:protein spinster homolog 1-like isoform X3 [Ostrea edulis]XP_048747007.1 protein spinster homolog 1-like isoform X3 [Ostrea edulis]
MEKGNGFMSKKSPSTVELMAVKNESKSYTSPIVRNNEGDGSHMGDPEVSVVTADDSISKGRAYFMVFVLLFINLLNYMDRFTIAGVLVDIQNYYKIGNSDAGLIQTVFIISYMIFSPIFGYLGDRFNRKFIMGGGIALWSLLTLSGSFIGKDYFWIFVLIRGLVGIGEASYSTIAPTIIADMFVKGTRTRMLMFFYFAIPVGSGLGYVVGANLAKAFGAWQWALRFTPVLGIICVILIFVVLKEPKRGHAEGGTHLHNSTYFEDLKELAKTKSFVLSTLGFTCVAFVTGALALWAPSYMFNAIKAQGQDADEGDIAFIFGGITVAAGFIGVATGAEVSRRLKKRNPRADPLVCAFGLLMCTPFLFFGLVFSDHNIPISWVLIFFGETFLCLNWSIIADILLYVVIPTRRSTAEAVQILISHALGDAGSPYLLGVISDSLASNYPVDERKSPSVQSDTMRNAFYVTPFVCVFGGAFFLATALFIQKDREKAEKITKGLRDSDEDISEDDSDVEPILRSDDEDFDGMQPFA